MLLYKLTLYGVTDQFGGPEQKKFSKKRLLQTLMKIYQNKS